MAMRPRSLFRTASVISGAMILSKMLGYGREALLAARFGATHTTDAYLVAQDIPMALFVALNMALLMVFIPVYREALQRRGQENAWRLTSTLLNVVLLFCLGLVLVGWVLAPLVVPLLVPGLPEFYLHLAVSLVRTMLPAMLFWGISGVAAAALNARHHFAAPAFVALVGNVAIVTGLFLAHTPSQIRLVAGAVVVGAMGGVLIQLPVLFRAGYRYRFVLDWRDPALMRMGRLILPVLLTAGAIQMQAYVNRFFASYLAAGTISALNYATRVSTLPYGVLGAAIATVLYPDLAADAVEGRMEQLRTTIHEGLRILALILPPMAAALLIFRGPAVVLFLQRGAFDPRATAATAYAMQYYAIGILFVGWLDFLNRSFFAIQETLLPMWVAIGMVVLNVGFDIVLVRPLAHGGLALGTSIATAAGAVFLLWRLRQRLGSFGEWALVRDTALSLLSTAVGSLAGYGTYRAANQLVVGYSTLHQVTALAVGVITIAVVHVGLLSLMGQSILPRYRRAEG